MPLTVYADILVIVNLYIDFFLLWCVQKTLGLAVKGRRLVLGALTGGSLSLLALLETPPLISFFCGFVSALAVTGAAFCPIHPRTFCKAAACFWAFSLGLAGFFLFLIRFFAPNRMAVLGNAVYFDLSPLTLFLCTCGAYAVFYVGGKLLPRGSPAVRYLSVTVENQGVSVKLWAKTDTGSNLREPFSGLPVIVCQAGSLKAAAPPGLAGPLGGAPLPQGLRLIPFETLGGTGVLPAFRPQRVFVTKTRAALDCWIAVSEKNLSAGQFNALLNPDLFPEGTGLQS